MMGMGLAAKLLPLLTLPPNVLAAPVLYQNVTIPMRPGTRVFTNPNEICLPASWTDILVFYVANYLAHVATLRLKPDMKTRWKVLHATVGGISRFRRGEAHLPRDSGPCPGLLRASLICIMLTSLDFWPQNYSGLYQPRLEVFTARLM
jgi:hypothetical protein